MQSQAAQPKLVQTHRLGLSLPVFIMVDVEAAVTTLASAAVAGMALLGVREAVAEAVV
jgi:hypothetical protein